MASFQFETRYQDTDDPGIKLGSVYLGDSPIKSFRVKAGTIEMMDRHIISAFGIALRNWLAGII